MTLDEIFEKYPDSIQGFYRKANLEHYKKISPETDEKTILAVLTKYSVKWLKELKAWANQESRDMGFFIPHFMEEDANANDWELYEKEYHDVEC